MGHLVGQADIVIASVEEDSVTTASEDVADTGGRGMQPVLCQVVERLCQRPQADRRLEVGYDATDFV